MNANATVLILIIIIAAMIASVALTLKCNAVFSERYGKSMISYGWAGVCGFAGMATISSFGIEDESRFIVLAVTAVLTVISMKKCKKRAAEMGADKNMSKKAMWIQFFAPLGIVGIVLVLMIGFSGNDKNKNNKKCRRNFMDKSKVIYRDNFSFWENTNLLLAYLGADNDVTVPKFVDSAPIEVICEEAFDHCGFLESVTLPDSIREIGPFAFYYCEKLKRVNLQPGVTLIEDHAFNGCKSLTKIKLPNGLIKICEYVFTRCKGLTEMIIPDGVISIGQGAFEDCKNLLKVTIPDSVTAIDYRAFCNCKRLEEIKLPAGLKVLADEMFEGCKRLKNVEIPEGVICIGEHAFSGCSSLVSLTIPDSVTALGYSHCYDDNDELSYYDDSEKAVFDGCTNLRSISYKGKTYDRGHIAELYKAVNG